MKGLDLSKLGKTYFLSKEELQVLRAYKAEKSSLVRLANAVDLAMDQIQQQVINRVGLEPQEGMTVTVNFDLEEGKLAVKFEKASEIVVPASATPTKEAA